MTKGLNFIAIVILLAFSLTSCADGNQQTSSKGEVISPKPEGDKVKLTILTNGTEYDILTQCFTYNTYRKKFEKDFGVDIEILKLAEDIDSSNKEERDAYIKKLSTKLIADDGAELIFANFISPNALIEQGAVVDLRDKVANVSKVYDKLLEEQACYIPIAMSYSSRAVIGDALNSIGRTDISLGWDSQEFYKLWDEWLTGQNMYFNGLEYGNVLEKYIDIESSFDKDSNKLSFDKQALEKSINEARGHIFGGKYELNKDYKYENYYNMFFEKTSQEFQEDIKRRTSGSSIDQGLGGGYSENIFRAEQVSRSLRESNWLLMPQFKDKIPYLDSYGFMINKKGKNLDLAYEFINGLLDDEIQMRLFKEWEGDSYDYYPVNKNIEEDIRAMEADKKLNPKGIEVKEYALQDLKSGRCQLGLIAYDKFTELEMLLYKDFSKYIFADEPYSFEELSVELQKLENKYNIWLNE